jgi:hypothetical protein
MFNKALEGIQPTFKQVPPKLPLFSIHTVFRPSYPAFIAATYPYQIITHFKLFFKQDDFYIYIFNGFEL